jgi:hypothetical protein
MAPPNNLEHCGIESDREDAACVVQLIRREQYGPGDEIILTKESGSK